MALLVGIWDSKRIAHKVPATFICDYFFAEHLNVSAGPVLASGLKPFPGVEGIGQYISWCSVAAQKVQPWIAE